MSYILKALRKSEAERAKGAVPKLTPHYEPMAPRKGRVWPWVAVAALVVNAVVGGAVLWRSDIVPWLREMGYGPDQPVLAETMPARPPAQTAPGDQATRAAAPPAPQTAPSPPQPPMPSPAGPQTAEIPDAAAKPAVAAGPPNAVSLAAEPAAAPTGSSAPVKPPAADNEAAASLIGAIEQTPPATVSEVRPKPAKTLPMAPEPPRKPAEIADLAVMLAAADQDNSRADEPPWDEELNGDDPLPPDFAADQADDIFEGVPMLWQMPRSFRSRLPKMNISVHVYSPDEPGRFVIIDRKKYWEGDNLIDGVVLEAIVPDGVVMEYQGQQFRLSSR